ncbi:MAG: nucleoid occlusion protein [Clostridia bacterium]|nr:nucleoid occlusion protein [Clostridia bacterium]
MSRNFTRCGETKTIPIKNIAPNPHQPRKEFDKGALQDLAISIMEYGLMQPITVRQTGPFDYELIAGERRLTACKNLGMAYIPAIVMTVTSTDSAVLALVENIQRENLNFIEEAEAFSALIQEHGLTQEQLADKLGKSQSAIANKLRILRLPQKIRDIITENGLTERHARALLRLSDDRMKLKAVNIIVERGFNVTKSEELIEKLLKTPVKEKAEIRTDNRVFRDVRIFANTIRQAVELMRKSGIDARTNKTEKDDIIEYTITIPKQQA